MIRSLRFGMTTPKKFRTKPGCKVTNPCSAAGTMDKRLTIQALAKPPPAGGHLHYTTQQLDQVVGQSKSNHHNPTMSKQNNRSPMYKRKTHQKWVSREGRERHQLSQINANADRNNRPSLNNEGTVLSALAMQTREGKQKTG